MAAVLQRAHKMSQYNRDTTLGINIRVGLNV